MCHDGLEKRTETQQPRFEEKCVIVLCHNGLIEEIRNSLKRKNLDGCSLLKTLLSFLVNIEKNGKLTRMYSIKSLSHHTGINKSGIN